MKLKEKSEKVGLKLNIQKAKIMAYGSISSWQINGETMEIVGNFIFWTSLVAQMVKRLSTTRETQVRSLVGKIPWRRKWQSTPVFLPGESQGRQSLVCSRLLGQAESDSTEVTYQQKQQVGHNFYYKEQASFNFMAVVTICSDCGAPRNKVCHCFHGLPICLP